MKSNEIKGARARLNLTQADMAKFLKLLETKDNFEAMFAIEQAIKTAKGKLIYLLMEEFEEQMKPVCEKYNLEPEKKFDWHTYPQKVNEYYYNKKETTRPGINYVVKDVDLPDGFELWFRIEIENNLFSGLCLFDKNAKSTLPFSTNICGDLFDTGEYLPYWDVEELNEEDVSYEGKLIAAFDSLWANVPTPFKRGDIVYINRRGYASEPFVLNELCTDHFDEIKIEDSLLARGYHIICRDYSEKRRGYLHRGNFFGYLDLEYWNDELTGNERILYAISRFMNKCIDIAQLLEAFRFVLAGTTIEGSVMLLIAPELAVIIKLLKKQNHISPSADIQGTVLLSCSNSMDFPAKPVPVEVKAEENNKAKSLKTYRERFSPEISVRASLRDFRTDDGLVNLPLYAIEQIGGVIEGR